MYGHLPYRSLKFEHETFDCEFYQWAQQINYPNDYDFTRIIEWKHATKQIHRKTTITREYPIPATEGLDKYYPIPTIENQILYEKYENEIKKLSNVIFCGRLAEYKYYNMDQIVARALMTYNTKIV
jgi:UDP-galactopyranose mutase